MDMNGMTAMNGCVGMSTMMGGQQGVMMGSQQMMGGQQMMGMQQMMGGHPMMAMGMNPMMMGMPGMMTMPGMGMSPMMGMNPMMAMMQQQQFMQQQQGASCSGQAIGIGQATAMGEMAVPSPLEGAKNIDPRIKRLCQHFSILEQDPRIMTLLQEAMMAREDFDEDMQALHLVMERDVGKGKKACEALRTHVRSIKANRFPGKEVLDKDIWGFACRYSLDDQVLYRLVKTLRTRPKTMKDDLACLDERLADTQQPMGLGLLVRLLEALEETGRLPSPPRRLGGSGRPTFKGKGGKGNSKDRDKSRSRSRSRDRKRSRSNSRRRSRSSRRR